MSVYIPVELQRKMRTHFSAHCAYCQTAEALTVTIFEIEHIIPRPAQGQTVFENLCLACPTCNRYKAKSPLINSPQNSHWEYDDISFRINSRLRVV